MAWKGLHLTQPARLSLADGQCCVKQDDGEVRVSIEDLAWIVLDTPHATLTSTLISACMDAGVAMIFTDSRHTPSGLVLPFHRHHRQGAVAKLQIEAKDAAQEAPVAGAGSRERFPIRPRRWRRSTMTMRRRSRRSPAMSSQTIPTMWKRAQRASTGAGCSTISSATTPSDRRNKLLNYGYAVVRAGVARALVASGFLPAFGLKHDGAANAFNLADDVVEPFRPFVDLLGAQNLRRRRGQERRTFARRPPRHGGRAAYRCQGRRRRSVAAGRGGDGGGKVSSARWRTRRPSLLELPVLERSAMKSEEVRFVWMFVFFDLPVGTKTDRRWATKFRNFLKDDGFLMLQLSVYARVCRGEDAADKHASARDEKLAAEGQRAYASGYRQAVCAHEAHARRGHVQ